MTATAALSVKKRVGEVLAEALQRAHTGGELRTAQASVGMETPKRDGFGDYATTLALTLAPLERLPPRAVADILLRNIPASDLIDHIDIAGPGYLNVTVRHDAWTRVIVEILEAGPSYGRVSTSGRSVLIEFVSANPTGPLHVASGRHAAFGLALANLLTATGDRVHREYYINDAGRQVRLLGESVFARYCTLLGRETVMPEDGYWGGYIEDLAREVIRDQGDRYLHESREAAVTVLTTIACTRLLDAIRADLALCGVEFDSWVSERDLVASGAVDRIVEELAAQGHISEADGAVWFRSTAFGDDKDRVLKKQDGEWSYAASDFAYHQRKLAGGFNLLINVLGADHHGYVPRIRAVIRALGHPDERLRTEICQLVTLVRKGKPIPMSKRSGEFITLREVVEEVGRDAALLTFQMRRFDTPMEFDLDLAKAQSSENPVYYIQYAHARVASVLRIAAEQGVRWQPLDEEDLSRLTLPEELSLLKALAAYPDVVLEAAAAYEPHRLAYYLQDLAGLFHAYYYKYRIITEDRSMSAARLALAAAAGVVLQNALTILGVSAPERM